ncbi:hypothetical protein BBK36DRAFT_1144074 [Trichoderma citrinoviride]|uniref:Uncharacterized protein n=1 Tax=Trichoderma citrinoviride TaxID=58853 RepID=A0A2T4B113_9HYPO|nr:hypothetical protein BBK36DRAFT_1144074 [Trichoderma citrinoviride]PTB63009.1 hypothetical protein BBK36DRAFT_1144074 [Trichoderma citrinoviride]
MADTGPPRRRFVPVPIETTFQSYRKNVYDYTSHQRIGPNPELTPEPSPRSPEAQFPPEMHDRETSQERRRFAPQLIETSRRVRRVGDPGPATRPTDKTDITPYTNHIYSAKPKASRRQLGPAGDDEPQRNVSRPFPPTRRETEEEGVQEYLLDLAAKQVARQIEEVALAAFPNSRPREGGVAHFYFRESSTDSGSSPEASPRDEEAGQYRFRRKSSNLGLNWWHKHMQEHAARLEQDRGDGMDVDNEEAVVMQDDLDAAAAAAAAAAGGAASAARSGGNARSRGERLQREKAQAERDEKILQEFGEDFVTQVYNYLSLGYPAMARGFDEELSRISHIGIDELRRDDEKQMAKGHMVEMKLDVNAPEEERCPRWAALRAYITEWARQHPDLDNLDPLAWGVRERRGSWAI